MVHGVGGRQQFRKKCGNVINLSFFYNFINFDGFDDLTFLSVSEKVSESIHRYHCYIKKLLAKILRHVHDDDDSFILF